MKLLLFAILAASTRAFTTAPSFPRSVSVTLVYEYLLDVVVCLLLAL